MTNKVAVIEDNETNIKLIRYQLESEGFDVHIENTGAAGLKMIKKQKPDIIILDIGLPDIDGFEVCRELRNKKATESYPIIMLTARGEDHHKVEGLRLGADDYITKPYNKEELILRINNVLKRFKKYKEIDGIKRIKDLKANSKKIKKFI